MLLYIHKEQQTKSLDSTHGTGTNQKERLPKYNRVERCKSMKITLKKMGMDFDTNKNASDVGNYRVRAEFTDKDGIKVVADFGRYDRRESYKEKNGKTGCRIAQKNALHVDGTYRDEEGTGRDYAYRIREKGFDFTKYDFTISGILSFLSNVTGKNFTEIEFIK